MNKEDLIKILDEGLEKNRITQDEYTVAVNLFSSIYEDKVYSESSPEHENLASLVNKSSRLKPIFSDQDKAEVIEAEISAAEEFINSHPILSHSPGDLKHSNLDISSYLEDYDEAEQKIWLEYYEMSRNKKSCPKI